MKRHFMPIFLCLTVSAMTAQEGIDFHPGDWQEITSLAREENKLIFVDAYTVWCGPCRMMSRSVFPERAVGDFFNENFISIRMNMEEGEGPRFAQKYSIDVYPSLLFIDGEGKVVHRGIGFHNAPEFLQLGRIALDPSRRLSSFEDRYAAGNREPEFLHDYAIVSYQTMSGSQSDLVAEYLQTQPDWSTEKNLRFIFHFVDNTDSRLFDYLVEHRTDFEELFGPQEVINRIQNLVMSEAFSEDAGPDILEKVDRVFGRAYPEAAEQLSTLFKMNYYQYTGNVDGFARAAIRYFNEFSSDDPTELNSAAWSFFEMVDDDELLEKAVEWAERSIELEGRYYHYDTLAALYYKLGKKKKAKKAAESAIEIAESNGEDSAPTRELLKRIKAM